MLMKKHDQDNFTKTIPKQTQMHHTIVKRSCRECDSNHTFIEIDELEAKTKTPQPTLCYNQATLEIEELEADTTPPPLNMPNINM